MTTTKKRRKADKLISRLIRESENRTAAKDAERQRREDLRVRQIEGAFHHYGIFGEYREQLLSILRDIEANGI